VNKDLIAILRLWIAFWTASVSACPYAAVSEIEDHSRPRPAGLGIRLDSDVSRLRAN